MEKYRDVFFVIKLQPHALAYQKPIIDPDPLISCDLMDGRDAFLTMAREKHWEFSTLRRTTYSSMAMLHEIHTSSRDAFVYTCNACKGQVETRYHCTVCDVSYPAPSSSSFPLYLLSYNMGHPPWPCEHI